MARAVAPDRLILDSGAVLALAAHDRRARAVLERAWELAVPVIVPAVVLAEVVRGSGPRDAGVNRVVKAVGRVSEATEAHGRKAGALLARAGVNLTIDALVVAEAVLGGPAHVATSDPDDLGLLAAGRPGVRILAV